MSGCSSGVEHNLAKVGVEGSNPFARSSFLQRNQPVTAAIAPRQGPRAAFLCRHYVATRSEAQGIVAHPVGNRRGTERGGSKLCQSIARSVREPVRRSVQTTLRPMRPLRRPVDNRSGGSTLAVINVGVQASGSTGDKAKHEQYANGLCKPIAAAIDQHLSDWASSGRGHLRGADNPQSSCKAIRLA